LFPPKNLAYEILKNNNNVYLKWTASINSDITGYIVYRKMSGEQSFLELKKLDANSLSFTDENSQNNNNYEYQIKTYKLNKISSDGSIVKVSMPKSTDNTPQNQLQNKSNTVQVLLTLFVIAGLIYLIVFGLAKFAPKLFIKKQVKEPLRNILNDSSLYEKKVNDGVDRTSAPENVNRADFGSYSSPGKLRRESLGYLGNESSDDFRLGAKRELRNPERESESFDAESAEDGKSGFGYQGTETSETERLEPENMEPENLEPESVESEKSEPEKSGSISI
jgi:hypothetical protein